MQNEKKYLLKRIVSLTLAIVIVSMVGFPSVYAAILLTAPYSGDTLIAVNTENNFFSSDATSQTTGILPSLEGEEQPYYSLGETQNNIMNYDENGIGVIDPNSVIEDIVLPKDETETPDASYQPNDTQYTYNVGATKTLTIRGAGGAYIQKEFILLTTSEHSTVWTPTDSAYYPIDETQAKQLATEFDRVYGDMVSFFGDPMTASSYSDPDNDEKVAIACYDIDANGPSYSAYIAGFFSSRDLFKASSSWSNGNTMDMLHMDSVQGMSYKDGKRNVENCYGTLVHEFQHLILYLHNYHIYIPTFLNEAFSEASTHLIYGNNNKRVSGYNSSSAIKNGNVSLTYWQSSLDNYYLSYLFGMYLSMQYPAGNTVYSKITDEISKLSSKGSAADNNACMEIVAEIIGASNASELIQNFHVALDAKESSGKYKFDDSQWPSQVKVQTYPYNSASLKPGTAIYLGEHENFTPTNNDSDIKFISIDDITDITGQITSYNANEPTTISLYYTHDVLRTTPVYATTISAPSGEGAVTQNFTLKDVAHGVYDMVITKPGHLTVEINDISKTSAKLSLTTSSNANISLINLIPGDVNADGKVNFDDISIMRNSTNYQKNISDTSVLDLADINGDEIVDMADIQIALKAENYNKEQEFIDGSHF